MFFHVFPQLSSKRTKITKKNKNNKKKVNFETAILPGQKAIFPGQTAIFFFNGFWWFLSLWNSSCTVLGPQEYFLCCTKFMAVLYLWSSLQKMKCFETLLLCRTWCLTETLVDLVNTEIAVWWLFYLDNSGKPSFEPNFSTCQGSSWGLYL